MLITLLYHQVSKEIEEHLDHFSNYPIVLPGDSIPWNKLSLCLTFDDAYYDFYHYVYPALKKFNLKALLAIPVKFILDSTTALSSKRLAITSTLAMREYHEAYFCTWKELQEMVKSGHVRPACHSHSHSNLLQSASLEMEIVSSKEILQKKLNCPIETFVYPYGKFNRNIHWLVKKHYRYAMRIGSACNFGWQNSSGLIYRLPCDQLSLQEIEKKISFFPHSFFSYLINSLRKR